jgi:hypothetical protein
MDLQINSAKLTPAKMLALGQQFPKATASALNRTAQQAKTHASALVRERYNIRKGDLDKGIKPGKRATAQSLTASVKASGRRTPLIDFGARGTMPARRKTVGVSVEVVKGRRLNVAGSFLAIMKSGHRGVFVKSMRKPLRREKRPNKWGSTQLPIDELTGPSVPQMFYSQKVFGKLKQFVRDALPKNMASAINFLKK